MPPRTPQSDFGVKSYDNFTEACLNWEFRRTEGGIRRFADSIRRFADLMPETSQVLENSVKQAPIRRTAEYFRRRDPQVAVLADGIH